MNKTILTILNEFTANITTLGCDGDIEILLPPHFFDKITREIGDLGNPHVGYGMGMISLYSHNGLCILKRGK
jgi:hypothetical protein